ncbi:Mannan endo-1,4-beta-mannosidase [Halosimplex carlsbadense 2-9-1]|uniref:mannan endo-1,4-beta-mannosidase n=1 Tax=Halosimplex carlsbadense 2-9-1 TaxID=797114 RepID=M0CEI4_9EURY|nr:cellulase family glycosylhydrolase [Halosimplex carlsbadense]ELZ20294.1 Mannan endo-1,4-beta-mannosidase [Halosimplex carlsbadense 2-9-1]
MQNRRQVLRGAVAAAAVGLAGCPSGGGGDGDGGGGTPTERTVTDACEGVGDLAPSSDTDRLGTDSTNTEHFVHPDGGTDEVRFVRVGTTDDAAVAYALGGELREASAQFHWHEGAGGDVRVEESPDGGDSWSAVDAAREEYGEVSASWHHATLSADLSGGVDRCRFVLTGGNKAWSGQLGHVEITYLDGGSTVAPGSTATATPRSTPVPTLTPIEGSADDVVFDHFVETDGTEFVVDGEPASFSGGNHPQVSRHDGGLPPKELLSTWTDLVPGLDVMRVPAFGEGQENYLQPAPGLFDEEAFRLLDRVIYQFGRMGVRLVMPLSNYWDWRGGIPQYLDWVGASEKSAFYTNDELVSYFRSFVETLLERENTVTGVKYKNDPTIMLWELANEPRAGSADYGAYKEWVKSTAEFVKGIDDNHLVSTGMEGFCGPDGPVGADETRYVETHGIDAIDSASYHLYPNAWGLSKDESVEWIRRHTTEAHEEIGKPAYCGEFGWEVDRSDDTPDDEELAERNAMYERWYEAMVDTRTDGAMVWDLRTESEYEWTSPWNRHAIYPRDEETVALLKNYTQQIRGLTDEG